MAGKKSSGGMKGGLFSLLTILILLGALFGWARANGITSVDTAYDYFKSWSDHSRECLDVQDTGKNPVEVGWRCDESGRVPVPPPGTPPTAGTPTVPGTTPAPPGSTQPPGTTQPPIGGINGNPDLQKAKEVYLATLEKVKAAAPQTVTYNRAEWKHWSGEPCNTRINVLMRDGQNVQVSKTATYCTVTSGTWVSPYDNKTVTDSRLLDIDHVIPLSYAAQHGGQAWPAAQKEAFANDMTQLLAVTAGENRGKGDSGPEEYMPPERGFQCTYSKIWVNTASKYGLTLTEKDKVVLKDGLQKC